MDIGKRIPLGVCALALLAWVMGSVIGCQSVDKSKWVGTWKGTQPGAAQGDDPVARSFRRVELIVMPTGKFSLFKGGMAVTGEFVFDDGSSTLNVREVLDRNIDSQPIEVQKQYADIRVNWQKDGTIRLIDRNDFGRDPVTLTKEVPEPEQR